MRKRFTWFHQLIIKLNEVWLRWKSPKLQQVVCCIGWACQVASHTCLGVSWIPSAERVGAALRQKKEPETTATVTLTIYCQILWNTLTISLKIIFLPKNDTLTNVAKVSGILNHPYQRYNRLTLVSFDSSECLFSENGWCEGVTVAHHVEIAPYLQGHTEKHVHPHLQHCQKLLAAWLGKISAWYILSSHFRCWVILATPCTSR